MRVALLSLLEAASGERGQEPRGLLPFGGRSVAHRQLELVLSLGAERVVCLAHGMCPGIAALQRHAEKAGAQFHLIPTPRHLTSLVRSGDELIVMADGILPLSDQARDMLADGHGVLSLPAETAIPEGFERIDLNHAWAGAMVMPGALAEHLFDLPDDVDTISALLRIALQAKIPEKPLPEAVLGRAEWALVRNEGEAESRERNWVRRQAAIADPRQPGRWLASQIVARFGPDMLQRGVGSSFLGFATIFWLLVALATARWFTVPAGLVVLTFAAMCRKAGDAMRKLEGREHDRFASFFVGLLWLIDLAIVSIASLGLTGSWSERLFGPIVLVGLSRLLPLVQPARWGCISEDRALGCVILAIAAMTGVLAMTVEMLSLLVLALTILSVREERR